MLGVLALIPHVLSAILVLLSAGIPSTQNLFLHVRDASMYGVLTQLLLKGHLAGALAVCGILWLAFIAWFAWRLSFLNKRCLKFWLILEEYPRTHRGGVTGMLVRVAVAALVFAGGFCYYSVGLDVIDPDSLLLLSSSFYGPYSDLAYLSVLSIPVFPLAFSMAGFAHSVITSVSFREFREKVRVPLTGLAALGICLVAISGLMGHLDMDKELKDIPGVRSKPEPRTFVMLLDRPAFMPLKGVFSDLEATPLREVSFPFGKENERAVRGYLKARKGRTCLRGTAYNFLIDARIRELDVKGAMPLYDESFAVTHDPGKAILAMVRIGNGPASDANRKILADLSDESKYRAFGLSAMKVGRAYAKYGELEKAWYWYRKGLATNPGVPKREKDFYMPPKEAPFFGCRITGRATLNGMPAAGLNVGVMKTSSVSNILDKRAKGMQNIGPFFDLMGLADGTTTDKDGFFSFDKLGENGYVILLSLKDEDGKKFKVLNGPGVITVAKNKPYADAGTIRLMEKNPLHHPTSLPRR